MEFALGAAYEPVEASPKTPLPPISARSPWSRETRIPSAPLAQALLTDSQYDEALKQFKQVLAIDSNDLEALNPHRRIQRRQGKYEDALATIRAARKQDPTSLEAGYNEGLLLDVLARYDEAAIVYEKMVDLTSHANGAYTTEEKNNPPASSWSGSARSITSRRTRSIRPLPPIKKMIDMGGDNAQHGFQGQVDTYRDARMFDRAIEVSRKAVEANPQGPRPEADAGRRTHATRASPTRV